MKALPLPFVDEMLELFGQFDLMAEWPAFLASFQAQPSGGLRSNRLKVSAGDLRRLLADSLSIAVEELRPVPWSDDGFYVPDNCQPGRLPFHPAGLYYIQEPSAMLPAAVLAARPGDRVLDLCAAPGGKSCRIAADLQGQGLLWANEISADRARALLHNLELTGCRNAVITTETPERLAAQLPSFFDKVLVDAPCSGSGMFRRDPSAMDSWLAYGSSPCTVMQRDILTSAWAMLRPGGLLVYSTCTFALSENEAMISWLLDSFPDACVEPFTKRAGVSDGLPLRPGMTGTARIWPHRADGDGHFCALLRKLDSQPGNDAMQVNAWSGAADGDKSGEKAAWQAFDLFCEQTLSAQGKERLADIRRSALHRFERDCLHLLPAGTPLPSSLKKVKTGLFLGQVKTLRDKSLLFEPSQALLFALSKGDLRLEAQAAAGSDLIRRYLRGETVTWEADPDLRSGGFAGVFLAGLDQAWPLGWAKAMGGSLLKNLYPQAWRRLV